MGSPFSSRRTAILLAFIGFPAAIGGFAQAAPSAAEDQAIYEAREILMTRRNIVHWLPAKRDDDLSRILRDGIGKVPCQPSMEEFPETTDVIVTDRFSEWAGDYVGFGDLSKDTALLEKVSYLLRNENKESVKSLEPLEKLHLQSDYQQIGDHLQAWLDMDGSKSNPNFRLMQEIAVEIDRISRDLRLTSAEVKSLPKFDVRDFLGRFDYSDSGYINEADFKHVLLHEEVSDFRFLSHVYVLTGSEKSEILKWMEKEEQVGNEGEKALFILTEDMSVTDANGKFFYTEIPKIIRTESVVVKRGRVVPTKYGAYLLSDRANCSALIYEKIPEKKGGVPFSDLPNAHNPYRTTLSVSCLQCHGQRVRISLDFPLPLLNGASSARGQTNSKLRQEVMK